MWTLLSNASSRSTDRTAASSHHQHRHEISSALQGRRSCGCGYWSLKICRRGKSMFWPPENVTFFHSKLLLDHSASSTSTRMKDLCQKWKVKLIFRGTYRLSGTGISECLELIDVGCRPNLKQFDGLTWLTPTPIFYDRSLPICIRCWHQFQKLFTFPCLSQKILSKFVRNFPSHPAYVHSDKQINQPKPKCVISSARPIVTENFAIKYHITCCIFGEGESTAIMTSFTEYNGYLGGTCYTSVQLTKKLISNTLAILKPIYRCCAVAVCERGSCTSASWRCGCCCEEVK